MKSNPSKRFKQRKGRNITDNDNQLPKKRQAKETLKPPEKALVAKVSVSGLPRMPALLEYVAAFVILFLLLLASFYVTGEVTGLMLVLIPAGLTISLIALFSLILWLLRKRAISSRLLSAGITSIFIGLGILGKPFIALELKYAAFSISLTQRAFEIADFIIFLIFLLVGGGFILFAVHWRREYESAFRS